LTKIPISKLVKVLLFESNGKYLAFNEKNEQVPEAQIHGLSPANFESATFWHVIHSLLRRRLLLPDCRLLFHFGTGETVEKNLDWFNREFSDFLYHFHEDVSEIPQSVLNCYNDETPEAITLGTALRKREQVQ
jgi:hypothetical protein